MDLQNLDDLNDDCLIHLFREFTLQERIHLRIICQRWKNLIETDFRTQTSLKLFGSFTDCQTYSRTLIRYNLEDDPYYKLSVRRINDEIILSLSSPNNSRSSISIKDPSTLRFLAFLFPNLKHLISCFTDKVHMIWNNELLRIWSDSLVSLSLFTYPSKAIVQVINDMPSLKRLDLLKPFADQYYSPRNLLFYELMAGDPAEPFSSLLHRLEHLSLGHFTAKFEPILSQIGPNMKKLMIQWNEIGDFSRVLHPRISQNFVNVTHLTLNNTRIFTSVDLEALKYVKEHFPSLTTLSFSVNKSTPFDSLMQSLGALKRLISLKLSFYTDHDLSFNNLGVPESNYKSSEIPPLVSVKKLHLKNAHFLLVPGLLFDVLERFFPFIQDLTVSERCSKISFASMKFVFNGLPIWRQYWKGGVGLEQLQRNKLYWISLRDDLSDFVGSYRQRYYETIKKIKMAMKEEKENKRKQQMKKTGTKRASSPPTTFYEAKRAKN